MGIIELFKEGKKVAEVDVTGFTIKQVVKLMRCQQLLGRTGKYRSL